MGSCKSNLPLTAFQGDSRGRFVKNRNQSELKKRALKIFKLLKAEFGSPACPLQFKSTEQLAVAVILSAQCTDERVNLVTPALFARFPDMAAFASADVAEVEKLIYSTGFYRNKAKNIVALARILVEQYNGKIPRDFAVLYSLPGIGRKTANVIMAEAFGEAPGITVDTHVKRITRLLGFTRSDNAEVIERELMRIFPKETWRDLPLLLIFHGRKTCIARRPKCQECILKKLCPSALPETVPGGRTHSAKL
jgi:endonuclease-3